MILNVVSWMMVEDNYNPDVKIDMFCNSVFSNPQCQEYIKRFLLCFLIVFLPACIMQKNKVIKKDIIPLVFHTRS